MICLASRHARWDGDEVVALNPCQPGPTEGAYTHLPGNQPSSRPTAQVRGPSAQIPSTFIGIHTGVSGDDICIMCISSFLPYLCADIKERSFCL